VRNSPINYLKVETSFAKFEILLFHFSVVYNTVEESLGGFGDA